MEEKQITQAIETYFSKFNMIKTEDEKLKYSKYYFTDCEHSKYLFYYKIFNSKEDLMNRWEEVENIDIALYLQGTKYNKNDLRWDMYYLLIYNGMEEINEDVYVRIERNRYCSRKIIISVHDYEQLLLELSKKLPLTDGRFYNSGDLCLYSNHEFFEEFRKVASLDRNIFTDELFENIERYKSKWIYLLSGNDEVK